jgi:hypothetical protein
LFYLVDRYIVAYVSKDGSAFIISVSTSHLTRSCHPEDLNLQQHRLENLQSRNTETGLQDGTAQERICSGEHGNRSLGSIQFEESLKYLRKYYLLKWTLFHGFS